MTTWRHGAWILFLTIDWNDNQHPQDSTSFWLVWLRTPQLNIFQLKSRPLSLSLDNKYHSVLEASQSMPTLWYLICLMTWFDDSKRSFKSRCALETGEDVSWWPHNQNDFLSRWTLITWRWVKSPVATITVLFSLSLRSKAPTPAGDESGVIIYS